MITVMTTLATISRSTAADLLALPDGNSTELVDGHFVEKPVSKESSRIAAKVLWALTSETQRTGEAEVYGSDLGYQCFKDTDDPDRIRKPDVSLIRRERLKTLPNDVGFMPIPADLAVEVLSPNDNARDVGRKIEEYLAAGFPLVWLVDPANRLLTVHRIDGSVQKFRERDQITGENALPGCRARVADLIEAGLTQSI